MQLNSGIPEFKPVFEDRKSDISDLRWSSPRMTKRAHELGGRLTSDPNRSSLGLLPSGPDPVGEWLVHRQPPGLYIVGTERECKRRPHLMLASPRTRKRRAKTDGIPRDDRTDRAARLVAAPTAGQGHHQYRRPAAVPRADDQRRQLPMAPAGAAADRRVGDDRSR